MAVMLCGFNAFAGSVSYDFRFDNYSRDYDQETNTRGTPDSITLELSRARLDFKGKADEVLEYRLRFRFDKATDPINKRDKVSPFVDLAYLTHNVSEVLQVTMGKFGSDIGGFEAASSADRYALSANWSSANTPTMSATIFLYYTGAKLEYKMGESLLGFHIANQEPVDNTVGGKIQQNSTLTALVWKGQLTDYWKTQWSYHTVAVAPYGLPAAAPTLVYDKGSLSFLSLGNRFSAEGFVFDLDYLLNNYKDSSEAANFSGAGASNNMSTVVLALAYSTGALTPKFEYSSSASKLKASATANESETTIDSTGLAFEYRPAGTNGFRYHTAYATKSAKVGTSSEKTTELLLGARFTGDFLKN